jgi:ferredoxin
MRVWIDQDLCTGDGLCVDHCPEVFVLLEDGISYVRDHERIRNDPGQAEGIVDVPGKFEPAVILAAEDCPGECIFIEVDPDDRTIV